MLKMSNKLFALMLSLAACSNLLADSILSSGLEISTMRYDGNGQHLYFLTAGSDWQAGSCNPTYVWLKPSLPGYKEMLSLGLAAKMAGKKVIFNGSCDVNPSYFVATHIDVM